MDLEQLIQTITDGALWMVLIASMLSTALLITVGTYNLIAEPELSDLLLFIGAGASLLLNLTIKGN